MSDLVGNPEDRFSHNEAHIEGHFVSFNRRFILVSTAYVSLSVFVCFVLFMSYLLLPILLLITWHLY